MKIMRKILDWKNIEMINFLNKKKTVEKFSE